MPKGFYKRNLTMKSCLPKMSLDNDLKISRLYKKGIPLKKIAKKISCSYGSIRRSLERTKTLNKSQRARCNTGKYNPAWKGGKIRDQDGYILIHSPGNSMANSQDYVREHRLVMSALLNRPLKKEEVVHHKNGDHSDNSPENLILFSNNGIHLGIELLGKVPSWTKEGLRRIASRSIPSMKDIPHCVRGNGARTLRKKLIQKYLRETSDLSDIQLEAKLSLPPSYSRKKKKH